MSSDYPFKRTTLYAPELEEISRFLNDGLPKFFQHINVSVVQCPDLKKPPFNLAQSGLGGSEKIADVGGPPYLVPLPKKEKQFSMRKISLLMGLSNRAFLIGAGAGPHQVVGVNSELMPNVAFESVAEEERVSVTNKTHFAKVDADGKCFLSTIDSAEFSLMANLFASEGLTGPVLKIMAKKRLGNSNFITSIRTVLKEAYGDKPVSLGGVFLLKAGQAKLHVMPDFSEMPLKSDDDVNNWLRFYEMKAPLICLSVLHSHDPGFDLRMEHTHCFSVHGEGGHYHYDTSPEEVAYEGYFNVAKELYRIDAPIETHNIGRD